MAGATEPQPTTAEKPAPRRRRWLILIALVVVAVVAFLALRPAEELAEPTPAAAPAEVVMQLLPSELHQIGRRVLRDTVQVTGSLVPSRELSIPAEVSGRIDAVNFRVGESVSAGDELVTIDVAALRNRLEQQRATAEATRAQLNLAQTQLQRATDLVQRGVSTMSALETDSANVAQLEASYAALLRQVETAEDDLSKARITAPFDGMIAGRSVDPGTYVTVGSELLSVVDVTAFDLEGGVPVVYAPRLQPGQTVELTVDGVADHSFTGQIDRIAPVAVTGTRVLPVFARIENSGNLLRGGMFAAGTLVLEESEGGIGIPADALREDDEGQYVLKLADGRAVRQPVEVARTWSRGRTVEIASGLAEGETIVALNLERLQDGMAVSVVEQ